MKWHWYLIHCSYCCSKGNGVFLVHWLNYLNHLNFFLAIYSIWDFPSAQVASLKFLCYPKCYKIYHIPVSRFSEGNHQVRISTKSLCFDYFSFSRNSTSKNPSTWLKLFIYITSQYIIQLSIIRIFKNPSCIQQ